MKVKYKENVVNNQLDKNIEYNVFSIEVDNKKLKIKYYINNSKDWEFELYPYDSADFDIIDENISTYWTFWINQFWDHIIWPKEIYTMEYFWERLYDNVPEHETIVSKYFQVAKNELFN